jgi:hypothetical protein
MFYLLGLCIVVVALLVFSLTSDRGRNTIHARDGATTKYNQTTPQKNTETSSFSVKN